MARPKPKKRNRRKIGARAYKNYSEEMLSLAVEMVRNKTTTSYDAEKQFGIPRRTIEKKAKNLHGDKPGPRYRFTEKEELQFVKVLIVASEFGCPLTQLDFRLIVFDYLLKNNKAHIFNNRPPGDWWVKNFLIRHDDKLTVRSTQNIKKARAEKSHSDFQAYFENLKISVENVPPSHILNYDETNLSDDPGAVKCIFRRGVKYPERVVNYSKGCISIMFSGTASGDLLAPYVVYKSENMWTQWCNGGPIGARYNRTKSGWFDSAMFMDWFTTIVIPWAHRLEGPKLVIGDNLSSHINVDVVELCERHNIRFVLLPPNSTHLTQPLDVAFFAPLKRTWRKILMRYKLENPKQTSLNKIHFPVLLKQLIEDTNLNKTDNLISGFQATGIFPYNPQKVYSKIPDYCEEITHDVDKSLLDYLKENRSPNPIKRNTNKKMNVQAGKSVTSADINKNATEKNTLNDTCKMTRERNLNVHNAEQVVLHDGPEKKKPKITILSEIRMLPKKDKTQEPRTEKEERKPTPSGISTKREEKAGPSGIRITTKREKPKIGQSVLKQKFKRVVKKKSIGTKRFCDSSSDSESQHSVQYADDSDVDLNNEDMQDHLLRQLIKYQMLEEQEIEEQMNRLETKEHEIEKQEKKQSMRTECDEKKRQEMELQMVSEVEQREMEEPMKNDTEKQENNQQLESQRLEINERRQGKFVKKSDAEEKQESEQSEKACNVKSLCTGQYILVKFESTKNTYKYYCGLISNITESEGIFAKFMRFKNGRFYWPTVPDTSIVFKDDILQILPNPIKIKRGFLYFDCKFKYKLE